MVAAGDPIYASDVNEIAAVTYVKQANETRTSTTTYADDGELAGIFLEVGTYEVEAFLCAIGGAGGIPIKVRWGFSGTLSGGPIRQCKGPTSANTTASTGAVSQQATAINYNTDAVYGLATSGTFHVIEEKSWLWVVSAAGNFAIQWAPNSSSATSGGLRLGSTVRIRKIG